MENKEKQLVEITHESITVDTFIYLILKFIWAFTIVSILLGILGGIIFFIVGLFI